MALIITYGIENIIPVPAMNWIKTEKLKVPIPLHR